MIAGFHSGTARTAAEWEEEEKWYLVVVKLLMHLSSCCAGKKQSIKTLHWCEDYTINSAQKSHWLLCHCLTKLCCETVGESFRTPVQNCHFYVLLSQGNSTPLFASFCLHQYISRPEFYHVFSPVIRIAQCIHVHTWFSFIHVMKCRVEVSYNWIFNLQQICPQLFQLCLSDTIYIYIKKGRENRSNRVYEVWLSKSSLNNIVGSHCTSNWWQKVTNYMFHTT